MRSGCQPVIHYIVMEMGCDKLCCAVLWWVSKNLLASIGKGL